MDIKIKKITARETYIVRHPVLRKGRPIDSCYCEGDDDLSTIHLGAVISDEVYGVASFMKIMAPVAFPVNSKTQYQLRCMGVIEKAQGMGIGALIMKKGFQLLQENQIDILWCNARINAVPFYEKLGFSVQGEMFDIPLVGPHYRMWKELKSI